jgi:hypothetical protein
MKLELKHLSGYLPYELQIFNKDVNGSYILSIGTIEQVIELSNIFKPVLRPLSELTKEIEVNGEKFVPTKRLEWGKTRYFEVMKYKDIGIELSFNESKKLLEWHFDIYGLIENNLAIDINTL